jgi:hypothetical protein
MYCSISLDNADRGCSPNSPIKEVTMDRIRSIDLHPRALAHHIDLSEVFAVVVTIGLALVIIGSLVFGVVVRAGMAPDFDQRIALDAQHILVIHNGASPTCTCIPNPPQHDCFWPGPERRMFSIDYLTPHGAQSLVRFRLPPR